MLAGAFLLDLMGLFCLLLDFAGAPGLGESISFVPDFLGFVLIGGWQSFGELRKKRKALIEKGRSIRKAKKRGLKFFFTFLGELAPYIGALPFWTWYVYSELKNE